MDFNDMEMTQVISVPEDSDDDMDREIRAVLKLHDQDAPAAFQTFNLKPGPNMVGRSRTCDVIIENYAVSKQHAVINVGGRSCTIMDLGSQNKVKIGKRTLKPNCQYNLDYGEEFTIAGLRARVLCDQNNGTNNDTGSDTCSESLLTAIEVALDQEGVDIKTLAGSDTNEKLYLPSAASEHDVGAADAVATSVDVSDQQAAEKSQDSKTYRNEHQSSGSFNLPEMPNLDYTQTDSEQGTEPYMGAGHETERSQEGAGMVVQAAKVPASDDTPSAKDSRTCTSMQLYSDDAGEQNSRDTRKFAAADEESRLNAETQPYAECPEVSLLSSVGEGVDAAADEMERLNAPTQAYGDHESAEAERLNAPTQAYTDQDDVERLNAATQPYTANDSMDDEERLNAVTQPYATDKCDEEDKLNAVTQPYTRSVNDDEGRLNAVTQPYTTADVSQNEHERLNDITHSFNEEEDDMGKDSVCPPSQGVERHRRLLTGPSELSFVLCEASQPCQEEKEEEEDDDEFCAPTQKEESPPLKVHALLKHRRERGPAVEDDKTPPLSPKTTVDETPPASPGVVPESDPEDDGDTSMVTARHSLPLLDATSATVYEDCVTPGNGVSSPVIGIVSNRRQRRGLSLKKPTCDTVPELPSQDSPAGEDWMQQEQGSSQSKASRKLAYVTEEGKDNDLDSGAADAPLAEPLVSGVERTDGHFAASGSSPNIPVKPQESIDANKSTSAEYSEMPLLLHMSEDMDLDINATEKEDSTACDTSVEEKEPTKACESSEITATTGRPSDGRTVSKDGSKNEQEETFEKHDSANPSFENKKTSKASPREEGLADIQTVPEQACEEEEQAIENDESANDSSKSEVESGRATRKGGKKKPPARAKRCTRKAAFANDAKKPLWRTILCRHEGAAGVRMGLRMKSLLSLEKRTSASGAFKEGELSQEINDKQSFCENESAKEPHEKAGRPKTRRGARGKAAAKEDELEVAPHHPSESLPSAKEPEVASSSDGGNNNNPSVKPGEDNTEGKAEAGDSTQVDSNKECQPKAGPSGHQEDVDPTITASLTPSLGDCDVNCTNATIDTCFSEPFPSFSEVMAECQPYIRDTEAQDEKNEPAEEVENTAAEPASESKATVPSVLEPEPEVKEPPRALRSKQPKEGVATRNRKAPEVDEELPTTRRKATRGARKELLAEAEPVAKDPASSVEQPKAPQPALPQPSNRAKRGHPYRTAAGRKAVPSVADMVPKITEDVGESEGKTEQDTAEDCISSIQQSEAEQSATPQVSDIARRGRPFRHEVGRKAGPSVSDKTVEYVKQSEGETDPTFAEDRLSGTEQLGAAHSAASQQSSRTMCGRSFRSAVNVKAMPSITAPFKVTEDIELSEGERNTNDLSEQETECIEGTLSEASECSPSLRRKAIPSTEVSRATRRGTKRSLQLNAKRCGEEANSESDTEHLSAQDTESIHETPLNSSETLLSESEALPRASAPRNARNARLSLQQEKVQADQAVSEGPTAESTQEPSQYARPQRVKSSAKTRSEREEVASDVAAMDDSSECVELSQSPRTSKPKRGAKHLQKKDEPFVHSVLDDSTNPPQTEAHSLTSRSSQRGRRNAKKPETQESFATEETQDEPPFLSTLDDSTQSLPTVSLSQFYRGSQRGRLDIKQLEMQDLSLKETEGAHVKNALDDSTQSLSSVESHSKTSQSAKQGKQNTKKPKTRNLTPEGTDDVPPVESALGDSMQSFSTECQSQNSRSSRQGRRNAKQPETLNNATPEETEVQNEEETHNAKPLRRGRKAPKLSSEAGSQASASVGGNNITSADYEPEIRRTRRGGDTVEPSSRNEQVRLTLETAEGVEPSEKTNAEVEPHSAPPRRGKRTAKKTLNHGGSKNVPEDDVVTKTFEAPEPANLKSSKAPRTTNLSLHKPTTDTKVLIKVESPSPKTSKRSSVNTAQTPSEDTEQWNNGDPSKVSARSKRKVTNLETMEDVTVETEADAQSSESTSRSPTSRMPALPMTVTRKRDAWRAGKKNNPLQTTSASVLETLAETSPQCPMQRVSRKRPVASMSFGEARHESDDEAADNEQETLDEIVVKPGLKFRRKELVKEAAVKQEVVEKAPAKRGKRKADVPEAKTEVPQQAKSRRDEQAHSSPAPKKTAKVKPKVLFTGIDDTKAEEQVVRDLGGIIATNPSVCTHLVTDKFRRTVKALCCIGKGTPIVDVSWIKKCREAGAFVDHVPHMLLDKKAEKALNFNLRDTLTKASTGGVLRGWTVHATAHVLPSPNDMKEIVACAGGKYLDNFPARTSAGTTVVISCQQDLKACARARNNGVPVVAAEFILSGLLRHSLDVDAHRLE
nr:LOW QUALITY PROTEIN: mediator of DNA damage checkpoint protein 1-like [Rhipicephalus microplus]